MRLGTKPRLALHITLWAVVGIALLALPALLSPAANSNVETPLIGSTDGERNPATLSSQPPEPPTSTSQTPVNGQASILSPSKILKPAPPFPHSFKRELATLRVRLPIPNIVSANHGFEHSAQGKLRQCVFHQDPFHPCDHSQSSA